MMDGMLVPVTELVPLERSLATMQRRFKQRVKVSIADFLVKSFRWFILQETARILIPKKIIKPQSSYNWPFLLKRNINNS